MFKRGILFVIVLVGMAALNTGFFNKKVDMNFVKTPDAIMIMGNQDEAKIIELQEKLRLLQEQQQQGKQGTEAEQGVLNSMLQQIVVKDSIKTEDKKLIDAVIGKLKKSSGEVANGDIGNPRSGRVYAIQFGYNVQLNQSTMADMITNLKYGYVPNVYVFPNDNVFLPMYDEKQENSLSTVKVRLDEATIEYLDKFYNAELKKN